MKRRGVSLLLFGEGKADAIFLRHVASVFIPEKGPTYRVGHGQGGSPEDVIERMVKTELFRAAYDRSLVLLDSDRSVTPAGMKLLEKHKITLIMSEPCCLEGMLLTILDNPPSSRERGMAKSIKSRFYRTYLKTDRTGDAMLRFGQACKTHLPADLLLRKQNESSPLSQLLKFIKT
jgi:hypothetical protein